MPAVIKYAGVAASPVDNWLAQQTGELHVSHEQVRAERD